MIFVSCSAVQVAGWTTGAVEQKAHRTITGPVDELQIRAGGGDVVLMPARGDDVVIDSRARGSLQTPQLEVDVNGYDVAVSGGCDEFSFGHCEATLLVQVPRRHRGARRRLLRRPLRRGPGRQRHASTRPRATCARAG